MCGIIGMISFKTEPNYSFYAPPNVAQARINIENTLVEGIKRLDYRGYDSWGVALFDRGELKSLTKRVGICKRPSHYDYGSHQIGIAHTRWATQGEVSEANAHPHVGKHFSIVHNGVIENIGEFETISSYERDLTDTEILLHYMESLTPDYMGLEILNNMYPDGQNSFLIVYKNELYVVCKGRSLYIGKTDEAYIVTSEIQTLSGWSDYAIRIDEGVHKISCKEHKNTWMKDFQIYDVPEVAFGKADMLDEIYEQINCITPSEVIGFHHWVGLGRDHTDKKQIIVGCGSSYNAALFGSMCFKKIAEMDSQAEYASEFKYWDTKTWYKNDIIAVSQSGETKDTLDIENLDYVIVNNKDSTMARDNRLIPMGAGPEFAVAATKTFTMSCIRLLELAVSYTSPKHVEILKRFLNTNAMGDIICDLMEVQGLKIEKYVETHDFERCIFLGSRFNYPMAREGALKMTEVAYVPSSAMPAAEIKHGPIALVDEKCLCVFLMQVDGNIHNNIEEVKSRKSQIMTVGNSELADLEIQFPPSAVFNALDLELWAPIMAILNNIPLQLLAYYTALSRDLDPNRPRNLAKTVTV